MIRLTLIFVFLFLNIVQAQTYVSSYVLSTGDEKLTTVSDSCQQTISPDINKDHFMIEYFGHTYFFKVLNVREETSYHNNSRQHIYYTYGFAYCLGTPYSIRRVTYGDHFTLWLIPMKFNHRTVINNKRAFVFTNDKKVIATLTLCK